MITGAHAIIYSKRADADRAFMRDALGLTGIDVGDGWLIFALPPSEVAVHPADRNNTHELFLLVDDVEAFIAKMKRKKVRCSAVREMSWGRLITVALPGGGKLSVYQPRHAQPRGRRKRTSKASSEPASLPR